LQIVNRFQALTQTALTAAAKIHFYFFFVLLFKIIISIK